MTRLQRLEHLARIGIIAMDECRTWRQLCDGRYDGTGLPNASMEKIDAITYRDFTLADVELERERLGLPTLDPVTGNGTPEHLQRVRWSKS